MTSQPLVSVVITCYNQARFLGETIESVSAQTYQNYEVVLVDDESPDDTQAVVARYPWVRYIKQKNQGVVAARNRGLRESRGEYIVFIDGDDRLLPNALQHGVRNLDSNQRCAFISGHCRFIAADGSPLPTPKQPLVERNHYQFLLQDNYIWMPAKVMYRRAILEAVGGFDPRADHASDYELYMRIARQFPVLCDEVDVAEYRLHGNNMHHRMEVMLRCVLDVHYAQRKYARANPDYREAYKKGRRMWQWRFGDPVAHQIRTSFRSRREWGKMLRNLVLLLKYCPRVLGTHLTRKVYCTVFRIKSDFVTPTPSMHKQP